MSPTHNDRKVQSGSRRRIHSNPSGKPPVRFAAAIAEALRREFGGAPGAVKMVVRLTGANERAVRNWFEAKNGPSGVNLVVLLRHSDAVFEAVLLLADRADLITAHKLTGARNKLRELLSLIDALENG